MAFTNQMEPIMAITEMTEEQAMNLEVFKLVQSDTAAGEKAITFIGGNKLKYELFKDAYTRVQTEPGVVGRVTRPSRWQKRRSACSAKGKLCH